MTVQSAAIPLYIGYQWIIPAKLVDPTNGQPLDISTWTIFGDLWLPGQAIGQATNFPAQDVDVAQASFKFVVSKALTQAIVPQQATGSLSRIMVSYTDGGGDPIGLRPIFIRPLDPRTSTL